MDGERMDPEENRAPGPEQAGGAAEFVARLQQLKDWSGLTYRELTSRAEAVGDVLPRSTVANMLSRSTLPREELVAAFVRACGCGPGATETWLRVRKELGRRERQPAEVPEYGSGRTPDPAAGRPQHPEDGKTGDPAVGRTPDPTGGADGTRHGEHGEPGQRGQPGEPEQPEEHERSGRREKPVGPGRPGQLPAPARDSGVPRAVWAAAVVVLGAVLLAVGLTVAGDDGADPAEEMRRGTGAPASGSPGAARGGEPALARLSVPSPGPVRIKAVHSGLCLAERGGDSGLLYQLPCRSGSIPGFSLQRRGEDWRIATRHPTFGPGCTGVSNGSRETETPLNDQECGKRGTAEAFRLEPFGGEAGVFRLRPLHSDLCVGVEDRLVGSGAEIRQQTCEKSGAAQTFALERAAGVRR
ncbi:helix-turn-helix domain-containing protein [Streptomyces sp. NPDC004609]|uniref:helix-turn-helix domain-containing protein n=1 Tax=Streptomyces sp. NPDC004609 TaxID=3364704 RepID=UPI0036812766